MSFNHSKSEIAVLLERFRFRRTAAGYKLSVFFHEISEITTELCLKGSTYDQCDLLVESNSITILVCGEPVAPPPGTSFQLFVDGAFNRYPLDLICKACAGDVAKIDALQLLFGGLPAPAVKKTYNEIPSYILYLNAASIYFHCVNNFPEGQLSVVHNGESHTLVNTVGPSRFQEAQNEISMPPQCTESQFALYLQLYGIFKKMQTDLRTAMTESE
ncbi:hypothetical protein [Comamonas thiooxydans]|uniref:hypothetical protein n=1 Tax=Comamonas thiooxydans TaxID=363952 RepID=UPI000B422A4F|nr:hypothetical protein [Comamonas thiooxydans]